MTDLPIHRTYEPLKFLGRLFWTPLRTTPDATHLSHTVSWDVDQSRWAPTVVVRVPFTRWAVGVGVWLDFDPSTLNVVEEEDAAYDTYVAVNGPVDRDAWRAAREEIADLGLDPEDEVAVLQSRGLFE